MQRDHYHHYVTPFTVFKGNSQGWVVLAGGVYKEGKDPILTTWLWGTTQNGWINEILTTVCGNNELGRIDCVFHCLMIRWCLSTVGLPNMYSMSLSRYLLYSYLYTPPLVFRFSKFSQHFHMPLTGCHVGDWVVVAAVVVVVVRNRFSHHNSSQALCAKNTSPFSSHITLYPNLKEHKNNINSQDRHKPKGKP